MNRQKTAAAIKRIEAKYAPATNRFELEDWISQQLSDTYHNLQDNEPVMFRFREAVLYYFPTTELINITRLVNKDITEHCVLLSGFLYKNYGVKSLTNKADAETALMLSQFDFELMAVQISEDLITWYETVSLALSVINSTL